MSISSTALFKIGSGANAADFTRHIVVPTYTVNKLDVYEEYEDGNYIKHHTIKRTKITGNFTMNFASVAEYEQFINALASAKNSVEGYYTVSLYANNYAQLYNNVNVYLSFAPANDLPFLGLKKTNGYQIQVEER